MHNYIYGIFHGYYPASFVMESALKQSLYGSISVNATVIERERARERVREREIHVMSQSGLVT